jgi:hypothetical protein
MMNFLLKATLNPQLMHSDKGQNQCVDAQQKCLSSYGYTFVVYQIFCIVALYIRDHDS